MFLEFIIFHSLGLLLGISWSYAFQMYFLSCCAKQGSRQEWLVKFSLPTSLKKNVGHRCSCNQPSGWSLWSWWNLMTMPFLLPFFKQALYNASLRAQPAGFLQIDRILKRKKTEPQEMTRFQVGITSPITSLLRGSSQDLLGSPP